MKKTNYSLLEIYKLVHKTLLIGLYCLCPIYFFCVYTVDLIADTKEEYEETGIEPEVYIKREYKNLDSENSPGKTDAEIITEIKGAIKIRNIDKAEKLVDKILSLNPTNKRVLMLKQDIEELRHMDIISELHSINSLEMLKNVESLDNRTIPYTDIIRFPSGEEAALIKKREVPDRLEEFENVKEDSAHLRLIPNPKNPLPRKVEKALNKYISIEFYDTPLRDVIAFLQEKIDTINITIDRNVSVSMVNLKLNDVPVHIVLKHLLPDGVNYRVEDDIIVVSNEILEMRVYDVRDLLINLDDRSNNASDNTRESRDRGNSEEGEKGGESRTPHDRVKDLMRLITAVIEPESWSPERGRITTSEDKAGDLIIVNVGRVHEQVEDILRSMRSAQHIQVNIEARFIQMSDKFLEDIGVQLKNARVSNPSGKDTELTFDVDTSAGASNAISKGLDLTYSILKDYEVELLLNAVQESEDAQTLTSPRITLSNTQRGSIRVINEISFVESYEIISQVPQPVISTVNDGTIFDVRPIVSTNRKHVFLEVHPVITDVTFENLPFKVAVPFTGADETTFVPLDLTIEQPLISLQELSVTVDVPDRGTLMIGGLGSTKKQTRTGGVPILSKIPILKRLFSRESEVLERSNLIIILKPTIIIIEEGNNFNSIEKKKLN